MNFLWVRNWITRKYGWKIMEWTFVDGWWNKTETRLKCGTDEGFVIIAGISCNEMGEIVEESEFWIQSVKLSLNVFEHSIEMKFLILLRFARIGTGQRNCTTTSSRRQFLEKYSFYELKNLKVFVPTFFIVINLTIWLLPVCFEGRFDKFFRIKIVPKSLWKCYLDA